MLNKIFTFFKNPKIKQPKIEINMNKFKLELHNNLAKLETKTLVYDYQTAISQLYGLDSINFKEAIKAKNENKEEIYKIDDKAKEEELKINSSFFNDFSLKILESSDNNNLIDIACKSFVGSTGNRYIIKTYLEI